MNLEDIMLSEVGQRHIAYDFTYMCNLKNKTNKLETDIDTKNKLMDDRGESG